MILLCGFAARMLGALLPSELPSEIYFRAEEMPSYGVIRQAMVSVPWLHSVCCFDLRSNMSTSRNISKNEHHFFKANQGTQANGCGSTKMV